MSLSRLFQSVLIGWALLMASSQAALADWHEVTTDHFIVYGEGASRSVVREAEQLERLDRLMRITFSLPDGTDGRRLPVYLVRNRAELAEIYPELDRRVGGFYRASPFGISASLIRGETSHTLFHEYAHHFMMQNFPGHYPGWFVEGFAEYFATADVQNASRVTLGYFSAGRVRQLMEGRWITMEQLLTKAPLEISTDERGSYYALSWLLTHYLISDPDRRRSLGAYLEGLRKGEDWQAALQTHLGMTPEDLRNALRAYINGAIRYGRLSVENTGSAPVIKTLSPGADDFILPHATLQAAVPETRALALLAQLKPLEARYPNDPLALAVLGNLEQVWGDPSEAERLLNHLLTIEPANVDGLRSLAQLRIKQADELTDAAAETRKLREAQSYLSRALEGDPTDFRIYRLLAMIRQRAPNYPTQNDLDTLVMALT